MKNLLVTAVFALGMACVSASALPDGTYTGEGSWKLNKENTRGTHTTKLVFKNNDITEVVKFQNRSETTKITLKNESRGFYDIYVAGQEAGTAYCISESCHFDYKIGGRAYEETYNWLKNGKLVRVGSRLNTPTGYRQAWTDTLEE